MNAKHLLDQIMNQASGSSSSGSRSSGSGLDVKGLINSVSSQLSGGSQNGSSSSSSAGGFDVKSLLGGGAMGMLMGSSRGRSMGGKAAKYAAIAGVGMMAWKAWQKHQGDSSTTAPASEGRPLEELQGQEQEQRSLEVLQAVIMAARADGHIDAEERALISEQMQQLGADDEMHAWVQQQLEAPLDAQALARQADSPQAAREIYLASAAVIDEQNAMERAWLDELASALGLEESVCRELERQLPSA